MLSALPGTGQKDLSFCVGLPLVLENSLTLQNPKLVDGNYILSRSQDAYVEISNTNMPGKFCRVYSYVSYSYCFERITFFLELLNNTTRAIDKLCD